MLVALGSNLKFASGGPVDTILAATAALTEHAFEIKCFSRLYKTPAFPAGSGPDFVNAAARVQFSGTPSEALQRLHAVESAFGRDRRTRWAARTLDIDLIAAGQTVLPDKAGFMHWHDLPPARQPLERPEDLVLPHPRMQDRAFVLVPLADVAPDWRHPVLQRTVIELLDLLPAAARAEIIPLPD